MEWQKGDMFELAEKNDCNCIAFTANSTLWESDNGLKLVMGFGAAKAVRDKVPGVDLALGKVIANHSFAKVNKRAAGAQPDFYCVGVKGDPYHVMAVQVKRYWKNKGDFTLTELSLESLASKLPKRPDLKVVMNCPLIGAGGFADQRKRVEDMVERVLKNIDIIVCTND